MPKPIRDQIIVTKDQTTEDVSKAGIVIVRTTDDKNVSGTVLAVGSGRMTTNGSIIPLEVQIGDKVLFNKNLATEVKDGDKSVLVLREDNVICVL